MRSKSNQFFLSKDRRYVSDQIDNKNTDNQTGWEEFQDEESEIAPLTRNEGRRAPAKKTTDHLRLRQAAKEEEILNVATEMMGRKTRGSEKTADRRVREMFGCNTKVAAEIWTLMSSQPIANGTLL
jgi:hypothetical protein